MDSVKDTNKGNKVISRVPTSFSCVEMVTMRYKIIFLFKKLRKIFKKCLTFFRTCFNITLFLPRGTEEIKNPPMKFDRLVHKI